jgi:hypothetical protein
MGAPPWVQLCTTALTSALALASAEFEAHLCINLDWANGNGVLAIHHFCCFF